MSKQLNSMQQQVKDFMLKMHQSRRDTPGMVDEKTAILRDRLVAEEANELCRAIKADDLVGIVDGICDLLYVTFGAAEAYGIDITPYFNEVHRTNMLKEPGIEDRYGKIIKPPLWEPPRLHQMLLEEQAQTELTDNSVDYSDPNNWIYGGRHA